MDDFKKEVGSRLAEERGRLGLGVQEFAEMSGVTRQQVSRIERGGNAPGGDVLAAFAKAGADIRYVLLGERSGLIDMQLLGIADAAIRYAYELRFQGRVAPLPIRPRMIATVYNQVVVIKKPMSDVGVLANRAAEQLIASLDDPTDPEMLSRNLFAAVPISEQQPSSGVSVQGDGNRVAGRDMIGGKGGK